MARVWRRRGWWRLAAILAISWLLSAGEGMCGSVPQPLQNRSAPQTAPGAPSESGDTGQTSGSGAVTATGSGGDQNATVVVTPPAGVVGGGPVPVEGGPSGEVAVPGGAIKGKDGQPVPAGGVGGPDAVKDGKAIPVVPGGLQNGKAVPLVPGTTPGGVLPAGKGKDKDGVTVPNVTAKGKGGDQNTNVLVTPSGVVTAVPGTTGKGAAVPAPAAGEPVTVAPGGKVVDAAGQPVPLVPGQATTLPQGGKIIDASGHVVAIAPGGQVLMPAQPMTPGDFLPKADVKPGAGKQPGQAPAVAPKPGKPEESKQKVKPQAAKGPASHHAQEAQVPSGKPAPPPIAAVNRPGDRIQIPEDACQKHSLDFLAGCWHGQVDLGVKNMVTIRLCFNASGVGKRVDTYQRNNSKCVGATRAKWGTGGLSFEFSNIYCTDGRVGTDVPIVCQGCASNTHCVGTEYKGSKAIGKTNFTIVRE